MGLIDWTAFGVFIKDVGGYFVIAAIALVVSWRLIRLNESQAKRAGDAQDRAIAVQESLAQAIVAVTHTGEQLTTQSDQHRERMDKLEGLITALAELVEVNNRKQGEYNVTSSTEYRANWEAAIAQMKGAGEKIDKRLDESIKVTGEAIEGVQTTVKEQHAEGTEQLKMAVDELNRKIESDGKATRDKSEQEAKETRSKLEPIKEQLDEIREALAVLSRERIIDAQAVTAVKGMVEGLAVSFAKLTDAADVHYAESHNAVARAALVAEPHTDPLAEPTKHATGTLPAVPDNSPDMAKTEPKA